MTIKELETLLGMTRANIRFYEQEGFLCPQRGENNYRIYSQEDVDTLRKIKLLRQLGLPLDTIRQVQQGTVPLDTALARQQRTLEEQRAELAWAEQVCSAMRSDRAEYATLDAEKYLTALDRPAEGEGYFSLKKDSTPMVAYPWRRFFARWLDLFLYSLVWTAVGALVLRRICIITAFVCVALLWLLKADIALVVPRSVCWGTGLFFAMLCVLGLVISTDFTKYFVIFHHIFFNNDLWLLDPATDLLINIVPEPFFVDTASYIALVFGISVAVIFGVSRWWLRREKRQRKQADGSRPANA